MKYFLLLFFLSFSLTAQYEYPIKENVDVVMNSTLAIQLLAEDDEFGKYANTAVKEIFNENWKLTEVVFMSKAEIEKLKSSKDSKYAYLTHDNELLVETRSRFNRSYEGMRAQTISNTSGPSRTSVSRVYSLSRIKHVAFTFAYYSYNLEIIGKKKPISVTKIGFANGELFKIDYLFLVQQLTHLLESANNGISQKEYYNIERNIEKIKNSQLMLPKKFFKEKDLEKMDSFYEFDYNLVDAEEYLNVILNKAVGKTYVKIIWSQQHSMYLWVVVNAEDGSIISQTGFGGVKFGVNHEANDIIKAKHLKYITNNKAQKFNSRYK